MRILLLIIFWIGIVVGAFDFARKNRERRRDEEAEAERRKAAKLRVAPFMEMGADETRECIESIMKEGTSHGDD